MNIWFLKQNATKKEGKKPMDETAMAWEDIFIDKIMDFPEVPIPDGLNIDTLAERSYDDGIDGAVFGSIYLMFGGFSLLMVYIMITLGKYNAIEQRQKLVLPYPQSVTFTIVSRCFENKNNYCCGTKMPFVYKKMVHKSISGDTATEMSWQQGGRIRDLFTIFNR